jgi:hypothetical protein
VPGAVVPAELEVDDVAAGVLAAVVVAGAVLAALLELVVLELDEPHPASTIATQTTATAGGPQARPRLDAMARMNLMSVPPVRFFARACMPRAIDPPTRRLLPRCSDALVARPVSAQA